MMKYNSYLIFQRQDLFLQVRFRIVVCVLPYFSKNSSSLFWGKLFSQLNFSCQTEKIKPN